MGAQHPYVTAQTLFGELQKVLLRHSRNLACGGQEYSVGLCDESTLGHRVIMLFRTSPLEGTYFMLTTENGGFIRIFADGAIRHLGAGEPDMHEFFERWQNFATGYIELTTRLGIALRS